jgi:hypothetical protein
VLPTASNAWSTPARPVSERDDLPGAADAGPLHDRQPHAATAEDRHGLPGLEARAPKRRPGSGEDAAAHERGAIQRQVVVDLHHRVLVQEHALGVAADARERRDALPLLRQPWRRRLCARHRPPDADLGVPAEALGAASAEAGKTRHHVVAGTERRHLVADGLDDPRTLVAEHDAPLEWEPAVPVDHVQVAVADPGRHGADQDLAAERPVDVDGLDAHRHMRRAADGSLDLLQNASSRHPGSAGV